MIFLPVCTQPGLKSAPPFWQIEYVCLNVRDKLRRLSSRQGNQLAERSGWEDGHILIGVECKFTMGGAESSELPKNKSPKDTTQEKNKASRRVSNFDTDEDNEANVARKSSKPAEPFAKKQPLEKRKINYEDIIGTDTTTASPAETAGKDNRKPPSHEANVEVHEIPPRGGKNSFVPPPPIENGDIVPLFPSGTSGSVPPVLPKRMSKALERRENERKRKPRATPPQPTPSDKVSEVEYAEGNLFFPAEEEGAAPGSSGEAAAGPPSRVAAAAAAAGPPARRRFSSSSSDSDSDRSTTRSKATEKTLVPSEIEDKAEEDEMDENGPEQQRQESHLTSRIYVKPDPRSSTRHDELKQVIHVNVLRPRSENGYVMHMFEKPGKVTESGTRVNNDPVRSAAQSEGVRKSIVDAPAGSSNTNRHVVNLQLYPGVEFYKTVIRLDKSTEDVSHLRDVFLKDSIVTNTE